MTGWAARAARVRGWFVDERWPFVVAIVAFALGLPSLTAGHMVDDLMHAHALRGGDLPGGPRGAWDLYRFADGGPGLRRGIDEGMFPWWSSPDLRFAFLRPLSSALVAFDHLALGAHPWVSHLVSCALYAALAFLVACLLRRILPGAAAGLAALMFAIDDAHHVPVLWIANRHALVSATLGIAALLAHLRNREGRSPPWLSPGLFFLALSGGESALSVVPYAAAWAWWMDPAGRRAGLRALWPWVVVLVAWAVAYVAGGYGTAGSAVYRDPVGRPLEFLGEAAVRLPQLLLAQVFLPPADFLPLIPSDLALPVNAALFVLLAALLTALIRATREHPAQRFLLTATFLSLVPCCATFPSDRLLLLSGVGAFGLVSLAIVGGGRRRAMGQAGLPALAALLVLVHLVLAPLLFPARLGMTRDFFKAGIARGAASLPHDPEIRGKTLVVLATPDALMSAYMLMHHIAAGSPVPDRARLLVASQSGTVTVERHGERTLLVRATDSLNADVFSTLYRARKYNPGERARAGDLEVEVLEVDDRGFPRALRFTFDGPVDASTQRWIVWRGRAYEEVPILPPGGRLEVPSTDWVTALAP